MIRRRRYEHPPERVWAALTDPAALRAWLGETDLVPEVGRRFTLKAAGPLGKTITVRGEVLAVEAPRKLELSWTHDGVDSRVVLELTAHPRGSELTVRHSRLRGWVGAAMTLWLLGFWRDALARTPGGSAGLPVFSVASGAALVLGAGAVWFLAQPTSPSMEPTSAPEPVQLASASPGALDLATPLPSPVDRPIQASITTSTPDSEQPPPLVVSTPNELGPLLAALSAAGPTNSLPDPVPELQEEGGDGVADGTIRIRMGHPRLHPAYADSPVDRMVQDLVFDRLYTLDGGKPTSRIVAHETAWPNRDGLTVELRSDVRWHDGHKLSAADVCFSWQALIDPKAKSPLAAVWTERIASCEAKGKTARIGLNRPWTDPRLALDLRIIPEHLLSDGPLSPDHRFAWRPVGTGPMQARRGRNMVKMDAADNSSGPSKIAHIELAGSMDPAMEIRELRSGETDVLMGIDGAWLSELQASGAALYPLSASVLTVAFDPEGVTADPHLREAMERVLDDRPIDAQMTAMGAQLMGGRWVVDDAQVGVRVGRTQGFPADRALEIENRWLAAGLGVLTYGVGLDALNGPTEPLRTRFDVLLLDVDLLARRHPLEPMVVPGPGNPFGVASEQVTRILEEGGEERPGTWMKVADALADERWFVWLGPTSSWMAVAQSVRVPKVSRDHPFLGFADWTRGH